jgi:hypothetical protein
MTTQQKIAKLQKQLYKEQCAEHLCCVCGQPATERHMSIMGQIPFYVCSNHYKSTNPAMGAGKMGLVIVKSGQMEWLPLPFFNKKVNEL